MARTQRARIGRVELYVERALDAADRAYRCFCLSRCQVECTRLEGLGGAQMPGGRNVLHRL